MDHLQQMPEMGPTDGSGTNSYLGTVYNTTDWMINPLNESDTSPATPNPAPFPLPFTSGRMASMPNVPGNDISRPTSPYPAHTVQQIPRLLVPGGFRGNPEYGCQSYMKGTSFQGLNPTTASRSVNLGPLRPPQSSNQTSNYYAQEPSNNNYSNQNSIPFPNNSQHLIPSELPYGSTQHSTQYPYPGCVVPENACAPAYSATPAYIPKKRQIQEVYEEGEKKRESQPRKKPKKGRNREPIPEYPTPSKAPESWGKRKDGSPMFTYNIFGELPVSRKYTAEEIRYYMENCPRNYTIFIQQSPTQSSVRIKAGDGRNTCMWMGCLRKNHVIDTGFFRIAFDEFAEETENGTRNPMHAAGTMHLFCFERLFDPVVDFHIGKLKPDLRVLMKEHTRNPMKITNKGDLIVAQGLEPWFQGREALGHAREYKETLSFKLNFHHLFGNVTEEQAAIEEAKQLQKRKKKKQDSCIIHEHKGNLKMVCERTSKGKRDKRSLNVPGNGFQHRRIPDMPKLPAKSCEVIVESNAELDKTPSEPEQREAAPAGIEGTASSSDTPAAEGTENEVPKATCRDVIEDENREETGRGETPSIATYLPDIELPVDLELSALDQLGSPSDFLSPPKDDGDNDSLFNFKDLVEEPQTAEAGLGSV